MKVLSVNVGLPRIVEYNGEPVATGIFKDPVSGPVRVGELNLEGDRQADLRVHGGYYKAVYAYPSEHYEYWRNELPEIDIPYAMFGENLTTEGLLETDVRVGDRFRIGTAEFVATQPRFPCFKLGIRFGRKDIIRRFARSGLSGIYFAILKIGELQTGDTIEPLEFSNETETIDSLFRDRIEG
jgi:MOSC domain-containing protein YiiM